MVFNHALVNQEKEITLSVDCNKLKGKHLAIFRP
jgi:hypothetical protein